MVNKVEKWLDSRTKVEKKAITWAALSLAAVFMVGAWILHLKKRKEFNFWIAFAVSMAIVIPEYLLNTYFTRYADKYKVFTPGQLATISLLVGLVVTFMFNIYVFDINFKWVDLIGFILIGVGGYLVFKE